MSAHILVIDDNPANLDLANYLLRMAGYEVASASDGAAGLQRAKSARFDLVLSDILMPKMDGYELARQFKSDPGLAATPLIAVTALAMRGDRERIVDAGFDGYISKPIDPQQFLGEIRRYLVRRKNGQSADR